MKDLEITIDDTSDYKNLSIKMKQGYIDEDFSTIFHADLKTLINFWKFDQMSIRSFKTENFNDPIRGRNPKLEEVNNSSIIRNPLRGKITTYRLIDKSEKEILHGVDYAASEHFLRNSTYESIFMPKVGLNKALVEHEIIELLTSETENIAESSIKVIDKSEYAVGFQNGRHRTRFLEFVGAKDIYILIPSNQLQWFEKNCKYQG